MHRDPIGCGALAAKYLLVAVDVAVVVFVDIHDPARFPSAMGRALAPIHALAYVDSVAVLDRFTARDIQGLCEEARVTGTHTAAWLGNEPTDEFLTWRVVIFFAWDRERRLFKGEKVYVDADFLDRSALRNAAFTSSE